MGLETLDDIFIEKEKIRHPIWNFIGLSLLWLGIALCVRSGLFLRIKVLFAIVLLLISTWATYSNYKVGVKLTLGTIFIGVFDFAKFFPLWSGFYTEINGFEISFNILMCLIGLVHYWTNLAEFRKLRKRIIDFEWTEEELKANQKAKIKEFKRRFSDRSIEDLEKIANNKRLVPEAIEAAKQLIKEET